jgi:hypothetical protein
MYSAAESVLFFNLVHMHPDNRFHRPDPQFRCGLFLPEQFGLFNKIKGFRFSTGIFPHVDNSVDSVE